MQIKPLNVITLGQIEGDNIIQMITINECFYVVNETMKSGYIKRLSE
jgi:hypothetical protein